MAVLIQISPLASAVPANATERPPQADGHPPCKMSAGGAAGARGAKDAAAGVTGGGGLEGAGPALGDENSSRPR